jgi:hypothetical protein
MARTIHMTDESATRRWRPLPLELCDQPLDVQAIVLGTLATDDNEGADRPPATPPEVVWRGKLPNDAGSVAGYWVQLLADGTGQCSCADYFFRRSPLVLGGQARVVIATSLSSWSESQLAVLCAAESRWFLQECAGA